MKFDELLQVAEGSPVFLQVTVLFLSVELFLAEVIFDLLFHCFLLPVLIDNHSL